VSTVGERTFALIKPDGVKRGLVGEIIGRFEKKGLKIVAIKTVQVTRELAEQYYQEHMGKPFFEGLMSYITSGPSVAMVLEGKDAVAVVRKMMGVTNPAQAEPGTIRGDLAMFTGRNVIHGSDSPVSAGREIALFFKREELHDYARADEGLLYE
jgi:nucleoside-diphosphate kinase